MGRSKVTLDVNVDLFSFLVGYCEHPSDIDGCSVVFTKCPECGKIFEEEPNSFRVSIAQRQWPLCLQCDPVAEGRPAVRVVSWGIE